MIFDFQSPFSVDIITYPEWTTTQAPAEEPQETIVIRGSSTGVSTSVGGSADHEE